MSPCGNRRDAGNAQLSGHLQVGKIFDSDTRLLDDQGHRVELGIQEICLAIGIGVDVDGATDQGKLGSTGHRKRPGCQERVVGAGSLQGAGQPNLQVTAHRDRQRDWRWQDLAGIENVRIAIGIDIKSGVPIETFVAVLDLVEIQLGDRE